MTTIEPEGVSAPTGGLTSFVNRGLQEGWSQRQTIREARAVGLSFRDSYFRTLWQHQEAGIAQRADTLAHPMDQQPPSSLIREDQWGRPGTYYTWIRVQKRVEGTADIIDEYAVIDTQTPVSPDEAVEMLLQKFADAETPNDTGKGVVILGADTWGFTWVPPLS